MQPKAEKSAPLSPLTNHKTKGTPAKFSKNLSFEKSASKRPRTDSNNSSKVVYKDDDDLSEEGYTSEESEDEYKPDLKKRKVNESSDDGDSLSEASESDLENDKISSNESDNSLSISQEEQNVKVKNFLQKKASKLNTSVKIKVENTDDPKEIKQEIGLFTHETLDFLKPKGLRDIEKRRPDHPEYDQTTLFVPYDFLKELTPGMQQWWKMKQLHFDVVLFYKIGRFYEMYHMDASVGVKMLGLTFMRGKYAHCGFPEQACGKYFSQLVSHGYKVARVEQVEKPDTMNKRIKGKKNLEKSEKTLKREICHITTVGTQQLMVFEDAQVSGKSHYLMSIKEKVSKDENSKKTSRIGICLVETLTGNFKIKQFVEDRNLSTTATILAHYSPCEILYERNGLSTKLNKLVQNVASAVVRTALKPAEFWDAEKTIKKIKQNGYFEKIDNNDQITHWPELLLSMLDSGDVLTQLPKEDFLLTWSALGACVYYLKYCCIDHQVIKNSKFELIDINKDKTIDNGDKLPKNMIIDSVTLANLEIVHNSTSSTDTTLASRINTCHTLFGRRQFFKWICNPLCNPKDINMRLDAVDDFINHDPLRIKIIKTMRKMGDLERMVMRVHTLSQGCIPDDHPDKRAVLFEEKRYAKKMVNDFVAILENFESFYRMLISIQGEVKLLGSTLLKRLLGIEERIEDAQFPEVGKIIEDWKRKFDFKVARDTGKILPKKGTNYQYDAAAAEIKNVRDNLEEYLRQLKRELGSNNISFKGSGNKRFAIDVPEAVSKNIIPKDFVHAGQRKGYRTYRSPQADRLLAAIIEAELKRDKAEADTLMIIFRIFKNDYQIWYKAVKFVSDIDCLLALANFARSAQSDGPICRPQVTPPNGSPSLEIVNARHPSLNVSSLFNGGDFIPNDTFLGGEYPRSMLLTGPNMGGKSTLMRQVGLIVILAQMGSFVPAESCKLTACDRVFTRLGASDSIMAGESTFYVELSETCSILKHATKNSLILLDELGRGTSTFDGNAIAGAVLNSISDSDDGPRTIFSTHYHNLVTEFANNKNVNQSHMGCMVDEDGDEEQVTFLYKVTEGPCPKSYGFHAARVAGIPLDVVEEARKVAEDCEKELEDLRVIKGFLEEFC